MSDPGWDNCGVSGPRLRPITNMAPVTPAWSGDTGRWEPGSLHQTADNEMLRLTTNEILRVCYILCQSQSFPKLL